ncbi:hypothetical protein ACFSQD_18760 [Flavihumibacter stibioxidans]|uniref:Uncharacterized protein n=1 Tax=Flavihumibacter stibioxidans TaxID=1834163 RepID=A0ABR7MBY1_9BACT|nr:hypothetical protein [Flavihumibacter stibioxidans]MBC6492545.1 hypothetical protein [Flavihumibacter stibioxidans]
MDDWLLDIGLDIGFRFSLGFSKDLVLISGLGFSLGFRKKRKLTDIGFLMLVSFLGIGSSFWISGFWIS